MKYVSLTQGKPVAEAVHEFPAAHLGGQTDFPSAAQ